ncbi:MAG: hypothetical protein JHC93_03510 [Parachlamydiales bacterium]|nr:hypothetical protein [Parachlamydiales bacterium]
MKVIKLPENEYNYIFFKFLKNNKNYKIQQKFVSDHQNFYILEFDDKEADKVRDLCLDEQQINGYDDDYQLTTEGLILESLIDKLFIGK